MTFIFDWIAGIFKYPMQLFYNWTGSYLLALILFALLVKIIMIPMAIQQQKTQIKGAKLRPKIAIIEKKYKDRNDRDALQQKQQEIMELQQKEGYSPLSGCLPLLIQLPVLMGIYQVIRKPLTYMMNLGDAALEKGIAFINARCGTEYAVSSSEQLSLIRTVRENNLVQEFLELTEVQIPDMTLFGGAVDLSDIPSIGLNWLVLIPILTAVLSYLSMKITRWMNPNMAAMASSPEQKTSNLIMDLTMPLMGVWIAFSVPAAVGFYWMMGYVFGILQTLIMAKAMPLPTFTEEEIRQYEKEMKASRAKSVRTYSDHMPPRRSLHHIDDDIPEVKQEQPKSQPKKNAKPIAGIEAAPKKDDKNENA